MALSGNWSTRGRPRKTKPPTLRSSVPHGDAIVLAGNRVPESFSRKKVEYLRRNGFLVDGG